MNPFLLAFLGALAALLVVVVGVYTYLTIKVKPMFDKAFGPRFEREAALAADEGDAFRRGARFAHGVVGQMETAATPTADSVSPDVEAAEEAEHARWIGECVAVLEGRIDPHAIDHCPMCGRSFVGTKSNGLVHLCEDHGRDCPGCPTILKQFEAFAAKQGIDKMLPYEVAELERLRAIAAGYEAKVAEINRTSAGS